jgi:microcystin degradation protein MlrC
MSLRHIAIARLWFEGNSFCPRLTELTDFHGREWHDAHSAAVFYRDSRTEMGAVVDWMTQHAQSYKTHVLRCAAAPPGGPLSDGTYRSIVDEILTGLDRLQRQQLLDGVYLSLHGSMVASDCDNPDFHLVNLVRQAIGPSCPLALSFDLHANLDPGLGELAQIMVGYKTYPHVDMYETAARALDLLRRSIEGEIQPISHIAAANLILPSHNMTTAAGPMREMEQIAADWVVQGLVLDATPFGGFAYADTSNTSASASVCVDARALAAESDSRATSAREHAMHMAASLANGFRDRASAFIPTLPTAMQGLRQALALLAKQDGCVAVLDPADNPLSGGAGDTTGLFTALLELQSDVPAVFAFFHDPHLVARAHALGVGAALDTYLGGRVVPTYGVPVPFEATIEHLTDGRFVNEGPMERGLACNAGRSIVLRGRKQPNLRVVVSESCQSPNDMAWCRLHRIDLTNTRLFCVKAKNHFRAAFAQRMIKIIDIDAPGPAMLDLSALPYRHIHREYLKWPGLQ